MIPAGFEPTYSGRKPEVLPLDDGTGMKDIPEAVLGYALLRPFLARINSLYHVFCEKNRTPMPSCEEGTGVTVVQDYHL